MIIVCTICPWQFVCVCVSVGGGGARTRMCVKLKNLFMGYSAIEDLLFQSSSRWYIFARKSPYSLHPVSQKFLALETVPMFVWLTMAVSRPFKDVIITIICTYANETYRRRFRSLLLCSCVVLQGLKNSLVCWLYTSAVGLGPLHTDQNER